MRADTAKLSSEIASDVQTGVLLALHAPSDTFCRIVDAVPDSFPYLLGASFYESATVLIPRDLWPSKPRPFGDWLTVNIYGMPASVGNTVPTWPGELYLNFGILGLLLGMVSLGILCAWLAKWGRIPGTLHATCPAETLVYAVTFPIFLDWIHEGSNGAVWYAFTNIFPVYVAIQFAKFRMFRADNPPRVTLEALRPA